MFNLIYLQANILTYINYKYLVTVKEFA